MQHPDGSVVVGVDRSGAEGSAVRLAGVEAATLAFAANFWQVSHPTPTLAALYEQVPDWGHVALDFRPRLRLLLQSTAIGLTETLAAT
jgi:hypothetical protein